MHVVNRQTGNNASSTEFIMVGGSSYHRVNGGPWQKDGEGLSSDSLSVFHRMPEPLMMGSSAKDLRLIGRDVVGGVATFLYELQFHPGQVSNRDSVLRIWIGIDDGLPRRFQLRMAEGNYKTPTISDEITTCSYGAVPEIKAPI